MIIMKLPFDIFLKYLFKISFYNIFLNLYLKDHNNITYITACFRIANHSTDLFYTSPYHCDQK